MFVCASDIQNATLISVIEVCYNLNHFCYHFSALTVLSPLLVLALTLILINSPPVLRGTFGFYIEKMWTRDIDNEGVKWFMNE